MWFFLPFSTEVWLVIVVIVVVCCVLMYLLDRFGPQQTQEADSSLCPFGSTKLCTSSFKLFGLAGGQPLSASILKLTWLTFMVLTGVLYLSYLIALVKSGATVYSVKIPYASFDDLVKSDIKYGYIAGGYTQSFFQGSRIALYERVYSAVSSSEPTTTVTSHEEGIARVKKGHYALIGETQMLEYTAMKDCELTIAGRAIVTWLGFGLATPIGSPYREPLNLAIMEMLETGSFAKLYKKWWYDKSACPRPVNTGATSGQSPEAVTLLDLHGFWTYGAVQLVLVGLALTIITAVAEVLLGRKKGKGSPKTEDVDKAEA